VSERVYAIVLAAGQGTRMRSERPKPLHVICGRPMVVHVLHALCGLHIERTVVVVGHEAERVMTRVRADSPAALKVSFVEQRVQRGTGDAVMVGMTAFADDDLDDLSTVLIVPGDTPLLRRETLTQLVAFHEAGGHGATVLAAHMADPTGYGRLVRDKHGMVARVVEEGEASPEERAIQEVNTSIYCFRRDLLGPALRRVSPDNRQGEYYLTDVVSVLHDTGHGVDVFTIEDAQQVQGVNDRWQLAVAERELRARINRRWLLDGVTMLDPSQTFIDATVRLGRDVTLYPGTMLQGATEVGDGCEIGPDTRLIDCVVGDDALVEHAVARDSEIGPRARVGPYAALGPGSVVPAGTVTGAFYTGSTGGDETDGETKT
jgi:bifunctional UDP-N-acetylglucosamine pyrophosphorylase / glucosamine-1-phosphate N-acetyltransferase